MASDIELEIAMGVVQLISVTIPIILGIMRYYLKDPEKIENMIESHDETVENADFSNFLVPLIGTLVLSFLSSCIYISINTNLFITLSLVGYGYFLLFISIIILVTLGKSIHNIIKRMWRKFAIFTGLFCIITIPIGIIIGIPLYSGIIGSCLLALLIAHLVISYIFNQLETDGDEPDPEPSTEDREECTDDKSAEVESDEV